MDAAKNGKGRQGSKMNIFENGPEMAQKLHFFNLSSNFSHGHWRDSGNEHLLCAIVRPSGLVNGTNSEMVYQVWNQVK